MKEKRQSASKGNLYMENLMMKKKIKILERIIAATAGAYYSINLTKNLVPGRMYQVINDKETMMPVMNGLTATRTIRSLERPDARTIPIIAMMANAFKEDAQKCIEAGINAHLAKPLHIKEVVSTIARFCRKQCVGGGNIE